MKLIWENKLEELMSLHKLYLVNTPNDYIEQVIMVEHDGNLIGYFIYDLSEDRMRKFEIVEAMRGKSLGMQAMILLCDELLIRGRTFITLKPMSDSLYYFYEKCGFSRIDDMMCMRLT